ncbi:MAG: response regulator [Candidatus Marinimicrobia bacterium]|nr:response regulator [Candidatus Neomarinimicrobiota bacterium]
MIKLSYQQDVFSFEFAALDYQNSMSNQYAYKMEGFNQDWIYTDASNCIASYTNLDPGNYVFHVKGSNNDGLWNEEGTSIRIVITPPWWKTNIAYFGYFLLVVGTFTILYRIRLARLRLQYQVEMDHLEAKRYHEMDELKSRFFANISHEFRTPLTLILGPIDKILSRIKEREWVPDLQLVQKQARRLLQLVSQLLDLSRLEAKRMKLQASQRNIIPLLKVTVLSFTSLADRKKITLTFNSDREIIQVYCEKDIIVKIINNLLSNALKFTAPGGKIEVDVRTRSHYNLDDEGALVITITDTGIGIAPERIDNIFNRFYQVDSSETREHEGAGIGLSLTKELVELHKGDISVESQEGKGTTFTVSLHLGKSHLKPEEIVEDFERAGESFEPSSLLTEPELVSEQQSPTSKKGVPIVLIVEDNTDVRNYIHGYLKEYRCFEAADGEEGLHLALKKIPDLIVSDIMMPKMDGVEFCKQIKSDERTSHIPVILLTAKADIESKLEGLETGADDYLTKPFEAKELKARVKNLIDQRRQLRERFRKEINPDPDDMPISPLDTEFLQNAMKAVNRHLEEPEFGVAELSKELFTSRQHLYRKLQALLGLTGQEFIRSIRLKRAARMLRSHTDQITQIAYKTGFNNPSYFTECFRKEFGQTPSSYEKQYSTEK